MLRSEFHRLPFSVPRPAIGDERGVSLVGDRFLDRVDVGARRVVVQRGRADLHVVDGHAVRLR